jgi:cation:H+ antiporter
MLLSWIEIIAGLILLIFGADRFVTGAAQISRILGVSPLIIGLTIVGIATSVPEILVGSIAALEGKTHIAVGNAIGSNIANISLVLGGAAIFRPFVTSSKTLGLEYTLMLIAILMGLFVMVDLHISRLDGFALLTGMAGFLAWTIYVAKNTRPTDPLIKEVKLHLPESAGAGRSVTLFLIGFAILIMGAELLVTGAVKVARAYGISDLVIGLTIIAVGTSLPELAASIMSILKKETDLAIGNIIGSNIFNMLAVLGIPVLILPVDFESVVLTRDFSVMLGLSLFLGWIIFIYKKYDRLHGIILLSVFLGYQSWLFNR